MMDPASDGTETQAQTPSSKSRPPVAKKPKPSVGKKPALSQKPATPPRKPSLNGTDESQHNQEQDLTTPNASVPNTSDIPVKPTPAGPALVPSKSVTSEKPIIARPKEPPPPLPKTPPKGPVHNKTPPPLPKNPPKGQGGIKATVPVHKLPTSRSTEQINDKIPVTLSDSKTKLSNELDEIKTILSNDLTIGNKEKTGEPKLPVIPPVKPKPRRKTIGAVNISSESHISQSALNNQSVEVNGNQGKVLEREVSVGNSTWFHASLDDADEQSNSNGPTNGSQTDLAKNTNVKSGSQGAAPKRVTSIGKSTFFVEPENECGEKNFVDIEKKETKSIAEKRKILTNTKVQKQANAEKSGSSNHPSPDRTPPPVPKKITHQKPVIVPNTVKHPELDPGDTSHATNNHNQSYSCDNNEDNKCELVTDDKNASVLGCAIKDNTKCAQPRAKPRTSISSTESLDIQPKSVPRKPIPAVKPRPTPKKRSSINRLSGSEQPSPTQTTSGSLDNLSFSFSSKDNTESNVHNKERKTDAFVDTSSTLNAKSDDKKAVTSEQEQEKHYRAIDKSVLGTSNKNTDEKGEKAKDITTELSSESFSFVELRKKFKETEKSDAQIDVPNTNNSHNANIISEKKEENKSSSDHTPSSLKGSFEDILSDKSILEPSSLLTEIEEILSRSYKHSSLTRSGSSPEKKGIALSRDIDFKSERSQSLDLSPEQKTSTPIRPPRPKKEAKRLRSRSQIIYDTCASDTESLPDLSVTGEEQLPSLRDGVAKLKAATLGPAKPHPPKPKRNKLLKVQRSQSDVTKMKSFLDQMETAENKISSNKNQSANSETAVSNENINLKGAGGSAQGKTFRAKRPTRKAPPPPCNVKPRTPSVDLNVVVPVDSRVKSINMEKRLSQKASLEDTAGSIYDSIKDAEVPYSSDEDHDYHEIPDHLKQSTSDSDSRSKSGSPPKLPPRNYSNSNSFDSSSQSGFVCDISVVDTASSVEDLSVSSAVLKTDSGSKTNSPIGRRRQISKPVPSPLLNRKLEVQNLDKSGLSGSNLSIPESLDDSTGSRTRPVSNASEMMSSSESEGEDEETKAAKKKEKKLFLIAQEVVSSERIFVDVLKLMNVDFRKHISDATENQGRPVIPSETLNRILDYLPQLQNFNEDLLKDLEERLSKWDSKKGIADIFVKKGPFLKLYTSYIRDFETMTATLDEALKKHPAFQQALKEFEMSPRCACLALKHYMLKPIQRIPQYRLLLLDYNKHLPADSPDMKDMQTALNIVSEVAEHANENMRHGDYVQKMLEIQRSLIGQFEVIKPGRIFLKEGELMKLSRKEMQPRFFFLFNDVLLYTTPVATGYKLNNVLPLAGMKVSVSGQDDFKNEFSIVSVQRSFTVAGSTLEERDDWVSALNSAIEENAMKRNTFEAVRAGTQSEYWDTYQVLLDKDFVLGHKPPIWIPDARVTMCMLCTCEFTVTWRRHHCRACGRVVCGNCSDNKAKLRYLKYKEGRVCDECFKKLDDIKDGKENGPSDQTDASVGKEGDDSWLNIPGLFERFTRLRNSKGADKKITVHRPKVLTEVTANDQDASMSGYLHKQKGRKWKKQWFVLKEKVLYQYKATQDQAATESMVLLGYEVVRFTDFYEGVDPGLLFQLSHSNTPPIVFKTDSSAATEKWVTVMREASVA